MSTIYCVGRNYVKHAKELGNSIPTTPLIFLASPVAQRDFSVSPVAFSNEVFHYEAELVLKVACNHQLDEKFHDNSISHLAFGIDVTRRDEQDKLKRTGTPWTTSKSFLGSKIIGNEISIQKFSNLRSIVSLRQRSSTINFLV